MQVIYFATLTLYLNYIWIKITFLHIFIDHSCQDVHRAVIRFKDLFWKFEDDLYEKMMSAVFLDLS